MWAWLSAFVQEICLCFYPKITPAISSWSRPKRVAEIKPTAHAVSTFVLNRVLKQIFPIQSNIAAFLGFFLFLFQILS